MNSGAPLLVSLRTVVSVGIISFHFILMRPWYTMKLHTYTRACFCGCVECAVCMSTFVNNSRDNYAPHKVKLSEVFSRLFYYVVLRFARIVLLAYLYAITMYVWMNKYLSHLMCVCVWVCTLHGVDNNQ